MATQDENSSHVSLFKVDLIDSPLKNMKKSNLKLEILNDSVLLVRKKNGDTVKSWLFKKIKGFKFPENRFVLEPGRRAEFNNEKPFTFKIEKEEQGRLRAKLLSVMQSKSNSGGNSSFLGGCRSSEDIFRLSSDSSSSHPPEEGERSRHTSGESVGTAHQQKEISKYHVQLVQGPIQIPKKSHMKLLILMSTVLNVRTKEGNSLKSWLMKDIRKFKFCDHNFILEPGRRVTDSQSEESYVFKMEKSEQEQLKKELSNIMKMQNNNGPHPGMQRSNLLPTPRPNSFNIENSSFSDRYSQLPHAIMVNPTPLSSLAKGTKITKLASFPKLISGPEEYEEPSSIYEENYEAEMNLPIQRAFPKLIPGNEEYEGQPYLDLSQAQNETNPKLITFPKIIPSNDEYEEQEYASSPATASHETKQNLIKFPKIIPSNDEYEEQEYASSPATAPHETKRNLIKFPKIIPSNDEYEEQEYASSPATAPHETKFPIPRTLPKVIPGNEDYEEPYDNFTDKKQNENRSRANIISAVFQKIRRHSGGCLKRYKGPVNGAEYTAIEKKKHRVFFNFHKKEDGI